jgi:transcriptional regulator with PAS, ATPase and Fis domain
VLQSGEFIRVGSSKVLTTDVRVIAATNVNLLHAVSQGKFREDLYYRLDAVTIKMPALRERPTDINLLFRKFASDFSAKYGMAKISLTEEASIMLRKYRWPGNIRQLKNVAEKVSVLESERISAGMDKREVGVETLSKYIPREEPEMLPATSSSYHDSPEAANEREAIIRTLFKLKQDVDYLKDIVAKAGLGVVASSPSLPPPPAVEAPEYDEDPEEQEYEEQVPESLSIRNASMELIEKVLRKHDGNRKAAASELGISERTLYRKLKQMN